MIARPIVGRDQGNGLQIIIRSMGGNELLTASASPATRSMELKEFVATELGLFPFGFDLFTAGGSKISGTDELRHYGIDSGTFELSMIKRTIPRTSSSQFVRIQSSSPLVAEPTFRGRQNSRRVAADILLPRLVALVAVLCFAYLVEELSLVFRCAVVYAVYLLEALCFNPTARGLRNLSDAEWLVAYIARMKAARPVPKISAHCWHWETQYRTITDKDGNTRTESYQEKVYTQHFTEALPVVSWRDESGEVEEGVAHFPLLQIHFQIEWHAADDETVVAHDRARQALRQRAQARDSHHDFEEVFDLSDAGNECKLPHTDMLCCTSDCKPSWLGWQQYVLCTLCGLSWLYRCWLARRSVKGDFVFNKQVSVQRWTE